MTKLPRNKWPGHGKVPNSHSCCVVTPLAAAVSAGSSRPPGTVVAAPVLCCEQAAVADDRTPLFSQAHPERRGRSPLPKGSSRPPSTPRSLQPRLWHSRGQLSAREGVLPPTQCVPASCLCAVPQQFCVEGRSHATGGAPGNQVSLCSALPCFVPAQLQELVHLNA